MSSNQNSNQNSNKSTRLGSSFSSTKSSSLIQPSSRWNTEKKILSQSPSSSREAVEVQIAGIPFRVKTTRDSETVQELVNLVDLKVRQALSLTKSGSIQSAAILAALNLAEELILLKREARKELEKIDSKVVRISRDLEEILEK